MTNPGWPCEQLKSMHVEIENCPQVFQRHPPMFELESKSHSAGELFSLHTAGQNITPLRRSWIFMSSAFVASLPIFFVPSAFMASTIEKAQLHGRTIPHRTSEFFAVRFHLGSVVVHAFDPLLAQRATLFLVIEAVLRARFGQQRWWSAWANAGTACRSARVWRTA